MDLYSRHSSSLPAKLGITVAQVALLAVSWELLLGTWGPRFGNWMHWQVPADPGRRHGLMIFNLVIFARVSFMLFVMLKRRIPPKEAFALPLAFGIYYVGFPLLALRSATPLSQFGEVGIAIFGLGSLLNTGAELERYLWKRDPAHRGHLFTRGLFGWSRHINYLGDVIWVMGYAIVTGNHWALLVPIALFAFFALYNAPLLDRHLATHYGPQYYQYARSTKMLVPWLF
jgi:protein-S-isoprenylcysteine O-methyltransferase Ste14